MGAKGQEDEEKAEEGKRTPRPYPKNTLEQALTIAQSIQDRNAGKPMKRLLLADAIGKKPASSEFKYLLSSSARYGLTTGTEKADYIELTNLGQDLTRPKSAEERLASMQQAAMVPGLFKRVFEHYKDAKVPPDEFFKSILEREFDVPREWLDDCLKVLLINGRFAGIIRDISGSPHVVFGDYLKRETFGSSPQNSEIRFSAPQTELSSLPTKSTKSIFIGHGRKKDPLDRLKIILDGFQVPYKVAIDEPNKGRPISTKVADVMKDCGSAIFIFTADEVSIDSSGSKRYKPSDNVVYELGAATMLYGGRIIVFKEEGVDFATDFKDFGYITFQKDNIEAKAMDLLKELVGLGFLKFSVA